MTPAITPAWLAAAVMMVVVAGVVYAPVSRVAGGVMAVAGGVVAAAVVADAYNCGRQTWGEPGGEQA